MKSILVTGGAGFMGSHLIDDLLDMPDVHKNYKLLAMDDLSGGFVENIPQGVEFIKGSINDTDLVNKTFKENDIDYVFHLAAYAAEGLSPFIQKFNYENNLIGSINLMNAAVNASVKCFVFTSSIAVYGKNQLPMQESMVPNPEDSYGIAKYAVEQQLKVNHDFFNLNYLIFRPHNVYGERQNIGDKYRNVVGIFMNQIMQNKPITIFGDGLQTRAFTYVKDITPSIAESILMPGMYNQVFNIGADEYFSVKDIYQATCEVMSADNDYPTRYLDSRKEVVHAYSDHTKCKKYFASLKFTPLKEGLSKMAEWAKMHGARQSQNFGNIEIAENLPSVWNE